jgi:hypothetical protein
MTRLACLSLAAVALTALAANPAKAAANTGTVLRITNNTDKAMTFFVEFKTAEGQLRHFVYGTYLKPGETMRYNLGSEWTIPTKRVDGGARYQIRVRAFRGRLESTRFSSIEDDRPDHWWGGNSTSFYGLKCEDMEVDGTTHLIANLVW